MTNLVGQHAANFTAPTIMPDGSIEAVFDFNGYLAGNMGLLFFYSMDHGMVCATELIAINKRLEQFQERNVKVVAVSTDSFLSHQVWVQNSTKEGTIGKLGFPIASDAKRDISETYGVLVNNAMSMRASFILDAEGVVRYQSMQDFAVGRNIDEYIRFIDAWQHHIHTGDVCQAGWKHNSPAIGAEDQYASNFLSQYRELL